MRQHFDRRVFLKTSAASIAVLASAPRTFAHNFQVAPASKPQKVIVVGAGIAGLVAAFELMQSGQPGEMTTMFPHVATVEGRVHFAGEHTSTLFVMEGAAQSGVRAAGEVGAAI